MPLISIIVPVYNVEKYLQECVDSVINQTYTNLEIILVDDASPDSCPAICDEYAKKDSRIKVIHRESNGGLSAARNTGIDISTGDYLFFIDSDDFIENNSIEFLYDKLTKCKADIAIASFYFYYKNLFTPRNDVINEKIMDNQEAFKEILTMDKVFPSACGKLYKSMLFQGVRYPNNMLYEDTYVIGDILLNAATVYVTTKPVFIYRQVKGSIMHPQFNPKMMQLIDVYQHCLELANEFYSNAINVCMWRYLWSFFVILDNMITCNATNVPEFKTIIKNIRKNFFNIIKEPNFSMKKKLSLFLLVLSPKLYVKLYKKESSKNIDTHEYFD